MFGLLKKKKMKRGIIINAENLETRVGILEDGILEEFEVEHPTEARIVGSIYKGRIQNLEHDLQAAFVDIGMRKNAFLHYWDMLPDDSLLQEINGGENGEEGNSAGGGRSRSRGRGRSRSRGRQPRRKRYSNEEIEKQFPPGSDIVVQVTKGPIGTKGPRVTASLSIPGRHLVLMPGTKLSGVSRKIGDAKERQRLKKILSRLPLPTDTGFIVRTAAIGASKRGFARDLRGLMVIWDDLKQAIQEMPARSCLYQEPDLVERVVRDWLTEDVDMIVIDAKEKHDKIKKTASRISRRAKSKIQIYEGDLPIFDHYDVERQLEEALRRKVRLDCGGYVVFDETEALIAVDVNTGRHKGSGSQADAILEVNTEAVEEVARQLRLRNIGGLVVLDLIDMKSRKHQGMVFRAMKASLKRDRARTNVLPISELGIMEMTRQRVEESILSSLYVDCPYCKGRGNVKSSLAMSVEIQRQIAAVLRRRRKSPGGLKLQITVHPTALARLRKEDEKFLLELESQFEGKLSFKSDPNCHAEYFSIHDPESAKVLYSSRER